MMKVFFDIRTLSLFSGFISACLFICMIYIYKNRKTYPGFGQWALSFMLLFIGFVLLSLRHILPDFFTIITANALIVLSFVFIARGLIEFADGEQLIWLDISPVVVLIVSFLYFSYISPDVNARIAVISLVLMVITLRCTSITYRSVAVKLGGKNLLLITTFTSIALWFLFRAVLTEFIESKIRDFMSAGVIHGLSIIVGSIGNIFIAIGLIVINAQRLENEVNKRTDELTDLNDELTDSEERYRSLSNAAYEGIVMSENGNILEVNGAMAKLFGYRTDDLVDMKSIDLLASEVKNDVQAKLLSGDEKPYETIGIKKDGTRFPIEVRGKMFTYKTRKVRVSAVRDLTDQKKMEAEVKTLSGLLPICASCKKIRDDQGYWSQIEAYISKHSEVAFSHGLCPECAKKLYPNIRTRGK